MRRRRERDHPPAERPQTEFRRCRRGGRELPPPDEVALKDPREWKLAGKPRRRLDVPAKVTGQPIYAIDVRLPGMLYAAVVALSGVRRRAEEPSTRTQLPI